MHYKFKKKILFILLLSINSFALLSAQEKNTYYIGSDIAGITAKIQFPDKSFIDYAVAANSFLIGEHFGKFRVYSSFFTAKKDEENIRTRIYRNDVELNNDIIIKYTPEISKIVSGIDFLISDTNATLFVGLGIQNITAKLEAEYINVPTSVIDKTEETIIINGFDSFWRIGYTWSYIEWSFIKSTGRITAKSNFVDLNFDPPHIEDGDYELSQSHNFNITLKYNF